MMMKSYVTGQFAGAQAVLHGQRLCHVSHRFVDLLQVTLVLHLCVINKCIFKMHYIKMQKKSSESKTAPSNTHTSKMYPEGDAPTSLARSLASFRVL